ncbi:BBS9 isoform 12, partial [Pan troglodytes]
IQKESIGKGQAHRGRSSSGFWVSSRTSSTVFQPSGCFKPEGILRVIQCKFRLPLKLICLPGQPSKTASHKITIDTNKSPVSLLSLFPGFASQSDDDQVNVMGFHFLGGARITVLASKTSQRYRIQSEQFEDLWLITNELILRLQEYFEKQGVKDFACSFSGSIPLQEYFELIDHHFELRING